MKNNYPKVEPHGQLEPIIENVWFLTGSVIFKPLLRLPRNMVVVKNGNELTLINSVRLNEEGQAALDALGTVKHVMKIGFHGMDDAYYLDRYKAKYWHFDKDQLKNKSEVFHDGLELPFPNSKLFLFKQTIKPEAAILIEREGGLLITCDSVQHWVPKDVMSPLAKVLTRIIGFQKPAQIGPPWKKKQTPPNKTLKADFERLAKLPFTQLIGGHGGLLEKDATALLRSTIKREFT